MHKNNSLKHIKTDAINKNVKATFSFMFSHPAHLISLGFGSGLSSVMPGTFGTLFGWASFIFLFPYLSDFWGTIVILLSFVIGIFITQYTAKKLNTSDPSCVVWDEIVAIWLVFLITCPSHFFSQLLVFVAFRFFDIIKPPPIRFFDRKLRGGFGIMFDDIVAAFFTLLAIAFLKFFLAKSGLFPEFIF